MITRRFAAFVKFDTETQLYVGTIPSIASAHSKGGTPHSRHSSEGWNPDDLAQRNPLALNNETEFNNALERIS